MPLQWWIEKDGGWLGLEESKLERPEPKAGAGPGQSTRGEQGRHTEGRMFLNKNRTGYNFLVSWRTGLFFNKMDKQGLLENMLFSDPSEIQVTNRE